MNCNHVTCACRGLPIQPIRQHLSPLLAACAVKPYVAGQRVLRSRMLRYILAPVSQSLRDVSALLTQHLQGICSSSLWQAYNVRSHWRQTHITTHQYMGS